jgi:predicted transcriptional regulator of viral defense system
MARGRPNHAEQLVLDYVERKPDRTLDLQLDAPAIAALAKQRGVRPIHLRSVVQRMQEKQLLHLLQRGRYVASPRRAPSRTARLDAWDPVADAVLRRLEMEYYVSWHSALWHYGLIDQQSRRIYVAVQERKRPAQLGLASVKFVTVAERKFFGRVQVQEFEWPVWMATPEKALIDSFDQPHLAAPVPVIANALREAHREGVLDPERLVADAIRFGSPTLNRRLGFFMDLYDIAGSDPLALRLGRSYAVPLAPGSAPEPPQRQPVNRRWRVYEDPAIVGAALELK